MLNITVLRPCTNGMVSHHITTFTFDFDTSLAMMSRLKEEKKQLTACLIPFLNAHSAFLKLFLLWYIAPKLRQLVNTFNIDNVLSGNSCDAKTKRNQNDGFRLKTFNLLSNSASSTASGSPQVARRSSSETRELEDWIKELDDWIRVLEVWIKWLGGFT